MPLVTDELDTTEDAVEVVPEVTVVWVEVATEVVEVGRKAAEADDDWAVTTTPAIGNWVE